MSNYKVTFTKPESCCDLLELYIEANWLTPAEIDNCDWLCQMVAKSFRFAFLYDDEKLIGMGRALSDGISDAYIQDIFVTKSYRGKKLGHMIVQALVDELKKNQISWIGLIAVPNSEEFYNKLNFQRMEGHVPMLLRL